MLLRRVIQHVKDQNWFAIAMDFAIVVVGVFLGIQVSNWNEARSAAAAERTMLRELRSALQADAKSVSAVLDHYRLVDESVVRLLDHLHDCAPYVPALDRDFGVLYGFGHAGFNRAAYESLKSQGLDMISNDRLRSHIAGVYEQSYGQAQASIDAELRVIVDLLEPYFLAHFTDHEFTQSATPLDYDSLCKDATFLNTVDYRLQVTRQNGIPTAEATIAEINALIEAIDEELGDS